MKVVVSSTGRTGKDMVHPRFGRAKYFVVVDTESGEELALDNTQNVDAMQGAGVQAAQRVAGLEPAYVITGHCGPKAFAVLRAAGIPVILGAEGTVRVAVERLKRGELEPAGEADVEGHWV